MPPKPQVFKTPDGKEFSTRAEWRDYMMLTFYTFKNKVNEPEPLVKNPGDIDGQMFDIADCENSTLIIMDYCEQVQIDEVRNCRIFIGACASSIFIRNCSNCVFYTSCRQLRLREVENSNFYIYSMAEVHIELSKNVKFAPFNGGYPEHGRHLSSANLDIGHNLWYDIFDHSDPAKTRANWSLIDVEAYEEPWFPAGAPCDLAIAPTKPGSVQREEEPSGGSMQSFSIEQMISDSQALVTGSASPSKAATSPVMPSMPPQPPLPLAENPLPSESEKFVSSNEKAILSLIATSIEANSLLWAFESISVSASGDMAWASYWITTTTPDGPSATDLSKVTRCFGKDGTLWISVHTHTSKATSGDVLPSRQQF